MDAGSKVERTDAAEQRRRFVLMLAVRAAVVTALLGSTVFFTVRTGRPATTPTQIILYGLAAAVFALTLGYALWLRRSRQRLDIHIQIQVVFDLLAASLLVYITGGLESPFTFFYALPIVQTAVFSPRRGAVLTAGLGCLLLGALFVMESQGLLPVDLEGRVRIPPSTSRVVYLLAFNFLVFLAIGWLAGSLGEQLRRTGRELRQTEQEVETMEKSMKKAERMAALGGMAAIIAHEIRNPLASISGSVQMLRSAPGASEYDLRLMDIIMRETGRLDSLLTDFLGYARPKEPKIVTTDLKQLVAETVEVFFRRDGGGRPEVICDLQPVKASVDPDQIRQVLFNLLSNADQAVARQGRIFINLRLEDDPQAGRRALVEIGDDGPGIPAGERERIFEPFYTTREQGTGLGLATVGRIVEAHGGTIELRCPGDGGSWFAIRVPGVDA